MGVRRSSDADKCISTNVEWLIELACDGETVRSWLYSFGVALIPADLARHFAAGPSLDRACAVHESSMSAALTGMPNIVTMSAKGWNNRNVTRQTSPLSSKSRTKSTHMRRDGLYCQ